MPTVEIPDVLSDTYRFQFGELQLAQRLKSWQDKIAFRLAVHQYLKRDGGELENMGRAPLEFTAQCWFEGPTWRADYAKLVNYLSENPRRKLTHPLLGGMDAGVELLTATATPAQSVDLIEFTLQIKEDRVDALLAEQRQTPSSLRGRIDQQGEEMEARTQAFTDNTDTLALVHQYITDASVWANAAERAANDLVINVALATQLDSLGTQNEAVIAALLLDATTPDAAKYPMLTLSEQIYAGCLESYEALLAIRPEPETVIIQVSAPLIVLCQRWYGGRDAAAYYELITTMNRVREPNLIRAGQVLVIPPPTMAQA